jgi:hypothetical protein
VGTADISATVAEAEPDQQLAGEHDPGKRSARWCSPRELEVRDELGARRGRSPSSS